MLHLAAFAVCRNKNRIHNNASAYIFQLIAQELPKSSVVVSTKITQKLKNQTEEYMTLFSHTFS